MSITTIPEKTIITCDLCNKLCDNIDELKIVLSGNSVENKCAIGVAYKSGEKDLCRNCYDSITSLMCELEKVKCPPWETQIKLKNTQS